MQSFKEFIAEAIEVNPNRGKFKGKEVKSGDAIGRHWSYKFQKERLEIHWSSMSNFRRRNADWNVIDISYYAPDNTSMWSPTWSKQFKEDGANERAEKFLAKYFGIQLKPGKKTA